MDINLISQLSDMLKKSGLSVLEIEENGMRIRLENNRFATSTEAPTIAVTAAESAVIFSETEQTSVSVMPKAEQNDDYIYVKSPMVGIFNSLEKLGKKPLESGNPVKSDTVVCAVEAMKMMCDIESEQSGEFVELMVKDGDQVEFGQPLIRLKKC